MLRQDLAGVFSPDGPIAASESGYQLRQTQLALAQAIGDTIATNGTLIAEAGTGTGKTWAYLAPALLSGRKTLVSTGTRTLQDQLFSRDIPRLRQALALPAKVALLKGRGNYVCHYYLARTAGDGALLRSRAEVAQLRHVQEFAALTQSGDKSELASVPEDASLWHLVTSTRENCLGQDCPHVRDCFVLKARRRAQEADLVVVNHALFMADLALREEGVTDLLPSAELIIFDEAHQLPDVATRFLGSGVSLHQLLDFCRQMEVAGLAHARETAAWSALAKAVEDAARTLRLASEPIARLPGGRATFRALPEPAAFDAALAALLQALHEALEILHVVSERHPDLLAAWRSGLDLRARLFAWSQPDRQGRFAAAPAPEDAAHAGDALADFNAIVGNPTPGVNDTPAAPVVSAVPVPVVRWVEVGTQFLRLQSAPLSVAHLFSRCRSPEQAWVLTSATLSVHGDFSHFQHQLGLADAQTQRWESPFDYANRALLYVPEHIALPASPQFSESFVAALWPLACAARGGVLVLCTTLRAVDRIADLLEERLRAQGEARPLLRQGERSRRVLLDTFREAGNAILVGSASFWEGIDVPGDALTLVAIDKLPFAPPDDPVLEARLHACRTRGGNPFMEYQLPEAAIALKQGAGRLIRSERDHGVLMVGDRRLVEKPYGKLLWRGLPPFARTRDGQQALAFLTTSQSASLAARGRIKRGSHLMEPKAPQTCGGEAPDARPGLFTNGAASP